jgi:cytochrome c biogenesis factor
MVFGTIRRLPASAHRWSMYLPLVALAAMAFAFRAGEQWRVSAWLLVSMFFTTGAFVAYTVNQIENAFPLLMFAAGLSAVQI